MTLKESQISRGTQTPKGSNFCCVLTFVDGLVGHLTGEGSGREIKTATEFVAIHLSQEMSRLLLKLPFRLYGWKTKCSSSSRITLTVPRQISLARLKALRAYLEVLFDFDSKLNQFCLVSLLSPLITFHSWGDSTRVFIENMKYATAAPMAKYLHNDLPEVPKSWKGSFHLFTGTVKKFLKARLVSFSTKNTRLFTSILQGVKRGCEQAPKEFVANSFLKHRRALTLEREVDGGTRIDCGEKTAILLRKMGKKMVPIWKLEASSSSCFGGKRSTGGARGFLARLASTGSGSFVQDRIPRLHTEYMVAMDPGRTYTSTDPDRSSTLFRELASRHSPATELKYRLATDSGLREAEASPSQWDLFEDLTLKTMFASTENEDEYDDEGPVVDDVNNDLPPLRAEVHAVLEPLKVRLITKGEPLEYWGSRPAQRHLWRYLMKRPQFALIGRPADASDFFEILSLEKDIGLDKICEDLGHKRFDKWVSGDYSAATDNLNMEITKRIFESFLSKVSITDWEKEMLRRVLYAHELHYPTLSGRSGSFDDIDFSPEEASIVRGKGFDKFVVAPALQTNGQLMGSPLSFPVLCIANFVAYWMAFEEYSGQTVAFKRLPVKVNGDDIIFRANTQFYEIWKEKIHSFGFQLSVGKNYIHRRFLMINSQAYHHNVLGGVSSFRHIPFFNVGMLTGQSKLSGRENARKLPIWDWYNTVMEGASNRLRTHRRFLHYHAAAIKDYTNDGEFSLFAGREFGGLGFRLYNEVRDHVYMTHFQSKFAKFFRKEIYATTEGRYSKKRAQFGLVQDTTKGPNNALVVRAKNSSFVFVNLFGPLPFGLKEPTDRRLILGPGNYRLAKDSAAPIVGQRAEARYSFWEPSYTETDLSSKIDSYNMLEERTYRIVHPSHSTMSRFRRSTSMAWYTSNKKGAIRNGSLQQVNLRQVEVLTPKYVAHCHPTSGQYLVGSVDFQVDENLIPRS